MARARWLASGLDGWWIPLELVLLVGALVALMLADFAHGFQLKQPIPTVAVPITFGHGAVCPSPPAGSVPPGGVIVSQTCWVTR